MATTHTFAALAVPTRRTIIETLAREGRLSASDISKKFTITASAISQHLNVLLEAGLILVERHGQQRIYEINPKAVSEIERWAVDVTLLWEQRLDSLGIYLESVKK